jgi:hypothetical protein
MRRQYRRADAPRASLDLAARWRSAAAQLRLCAVCGRHFSDGERILCGEVYAQNGCVLYRMCRMCDARLYRDVVALKSFVESAIRSLYGAGPDDVGGSA